MKQDPQFDIKRNRSKLTSLKYKLLKDANIKIKSEDY